MRHIPLKDLWSAFKELGIDGIHALEAASESETYGTNCFEVVLSELPYVAIRFHYNQYDDVVRPLIVRIHIKKDGKEVPKELVKSTLPALISAEEDEEWLSIALRPPTGNALDVLKTGMEIAKRVQEALDLKGPIGVLGHLPVDCGPYLDYSNKRSTT